MSTILVVAPHPDDETLGCGGTLLRHVAAGDAVHWLIVTHLSETVGTSAERIATREQEIEQVAVRYGMAGTTNLEFPTTRLDTIPIGDLVASIGEVVQAVEPHIVYLPFRNDIHTDHALVFDAAASCTKWFRYPSIQRVLAYETLSETDFALDPDVAGFRPTVFVDVTNYLDKKIEIMHIFESEMGTAPFPRSEAVLRSLATLRGAAAGYDAAEAFMLLKERIE
jgi:LmbE family N-acetylglucosaminyl deacetylase